MRLWVTKGANQTGRGTQGLLRPLGDGVLRGSWLWIPPNPHVKKKKNWKAEPKSSTYDKIQLKTPICPQKSRRGYIQGFQFLLRKWGSGPSDLSFPESIWSSLLLPVFTVGLSLGTVGQVRLFQRALDLPGWSLHPHGKKRRTRLGRWGARRQDSPPAAPGLRRAVPRALEDGRRLRDSHCPQAGERKGLLEVCGLSPRNLQDDQETPCVRCQATCLAGYRLKQAQTIREGSGPRHRKAQKPAYFTQI